MIAAVLVVVQVVGCCAVHDNRRLCLGGLCLFAALGGSLLFLHLLVAHRGERTTNLLDLVTGQLLGQLLGELLKKQAVMSLLRGGTDDRGEDVAKLLKLSLGLRVEQGEAG